MRPQQRLANRVDSYVKGRPGYPDAVVPWLAAVFDLAPPAPIADVGAGTGISAELFLRHGFEVHAVEPNAPMRDAAVARLGGNPRFHAHDGSAEATGLPEESVALVVAAQAFHWFDPGAFKRECVRILKPGGPIALLWNVRRLTGSAFAMDYEALLREFGTDYLTVRHENVVHAEILAFFGGPYAHRDFGNAQILDYDGLRARLLSSSYVPAAGQPRHEAMVEALESLFRKHEANGRVVMDYDLKAYAAAPSA